MRPLISRFGRLPLAPHTTFLYPMTEPENDDSLLDSSSANYHLARITTSHTYAAAGRIIPRYFDNTETTGARLLNNTQGFTNTTATIGSAFDLHRNRWRNDSQGAAMMCVVNPGAVSGLYDVVNIAAGQTNNAAFTDLARIRINSSQFQFTVQRWVGGVATDQVMTIPYTLVIGRTYFVAVSKSPKYYINQQTDYTFYLYDPLADVVVDQTTNLQRMLSNHGTNCRINVGCYRNGTTSTTTANPVVASRIWDVRFDNRQINNRFEFLFLARQIFSYRVGL